MRFVIRYEVEFRVLSVDLSSVMCQSRLISVLVLVTTPQFYKKMMANRVTEGMTLGTVTLPTSDSSSTSRRRGFAYPRYDRRPALAKSPSTNVNRWIVCSSSDASRRNRRYD